MTQQRVVFRRFKEQRREVIALLPDNEVNPGNIDTYMHIGQHGEASYPHIIDITEPISKHDPDAVELFKELTGPVGYDLRVVKNVQHIRRAA